MVHTRGGGGGDVKIHWMKIQDGNGKFRKIRKKKLKFCEILTGLQTFDRDMLTYKYGSGFFSLYET